MKNKIYLAFVLLTTILIYNSCKKSTTPTPVAKFNYTGAGVPPPATVHFINNSSEAASYIWDFGDSTTSTEKNPQHIYTVAGLFHVTLTANGAGGTNSITKTISIVNTAIIKADFTITGGGHIAPCEVSFTDSSTGATAWRWDFGDGHKDTLQNPTHTYTTGGNFSVKLISTGAAGKDSIIKTVNVLPPPTVCKITSISVLKCTLNNTAGSPLDTSSAPDFYVNIETSAGNIFYNGSAFYNTDLDTFPQTWTINPSSDILSVNWNFNYKIHIWDKDGPDPDDNAGYCLFKAGDYTTLTDHYPTQVTLVNGITKIKLTLVWQ